MSTPSKGAPKDGSGTSARSGKVVGGARKAAGVRSPSTKSSSKQPDVAAFGIRLKSLRLAAGMTQTELAEASGLHRVTISDAERGAQELGVTRAARLAAALGVDPGELFTRTGD